ncbi:hypothetical protein R3P38DRAFT_3213021 [Favolaschia claudopus]|uniref:Uncharacterized protein n=1 Tax=Favolaschia claudopus TaxID=2862362 RepID=A0AAW0ACL3_9AGAR
MAPFEPTPKYCRYKLSCQDRNSASPAPACCEFRFEHRNYAVFVSDAETMVLRTKLSVYFNLNAEAMPFSSQRASLIEDAEIMPLRAKLAVYFQFNAETMLLSSQTYAALNRARARIYAIEGSI